MGSFWLWGWWFFLTLPDRLSCPLFIYMVHFEFEFTKYKSKGGDVRHIFIFRFPIIDFGKTFMLKIRT